MNKVETKKGRLYGVCCGGESECVVTDDETGNVLLTLDGSKQEVFIAPGGAVWVSDDSAIVTELFKLAPCRGVAAMMLLRKAGGWLPKGFTELEYLESSGVQFVATNWAVDGTSGARVAWSMTKKTDYANVFSARNMDWDGNVINPGTLCVPYWNGVAVPFKGEFMNSSDNTYALDEEVEVEKIYISSTNYLNDRQIRLNGTSLGDIPSDAPNIVVNNMVLWGSSRNGEVFKKAPLIGRIYSVSVSKDYSNIHHLVPVLDAEGTPCMYDRVSRQCIYNSGTGTFGYRIKRSGQEVSPMSLRDPWRVAPSGVYARPSGENALEIIADTEDTTGEGWEWFANTAEAYEHFGIVPQEEELLTE